MPDNTFRIHTYIVYVQSECTATYSFSYVGNGQGVNTNDAYDDAISISFPHALRHIGFLKNESQMMIFCC